MPSSIISASELPASTLSGRVSRGELVRLAQGIYTSEIGRPVEEVVRSEIFEIAGRLFPGAVITDRSARSGAPSNGVLYLARDGRRRDVELPGLRISARPGAGPLGGDVRLPAGLYLASRARGLAENAMPSRIRSGQARTLSIEELGDWVDFLCQVEGPAKLHAYRAEAAKLASQLGVPAAALERLHAAVGVALGTRDANDDTSKALASRARGRPVDQERVERLELLAAALRAAAPQSQPLVKERFEFLPFFESYFSNFIEGTEFEVDEAARIVFDDEIPADRPADAHDIIGTYRLVVDDDEMAQTGDGADEFLELITRRNARIMEGRPDKRPGEYKLIANRAGATYFVDPTQVEGTLEAGFRLRDSLDTAWERAAYVAFLVAEVHPFDDGNGRTARVMMNAELHAAGQTRIIIPTVFRFDYLDGLRMLSRQNDPSVFIKAMRYAHDFTASIDFSDYTTAREQLEQANAFNEPDSAQRLRILGARSVATDPAPWRR